MVLRNSKSLLLNKPGFGEKYLLAPKEVGVMTKQHKLCVEDLARQKAVPKSLLLFHKSQFSQRPLLLTRARHFQTVEWNYFASASRSGFMHSPTL